MQTLHRGWREHPWCDLSEEEIGQHIKMYQLGEGGYSKDEIASPGTGQNSTGTDHGKVRGKAHGEFTREVQKVQNLKN